MESIRRRHNYLPFIMEMLKVLAEDGRLVDLVEQVSLLNVKLTAAVVNNAIVSF